MESLAPEVAPFGIHTTIVNPGFFQTELLSQESTTYATPSIADYADRHAERVRWYESMNRQQAGAPPPSLREPSSRSPAWSGRQPDSSAAPMPSSWPSRRRRT